MIRCVSMCAEKRRKDAADQAAGKTGDCWPSMVDVFTTLEIVEGPVLPPMRSPTTQNLLDQGGENIASVAKALSGLPAPALPHAKRLDILEASMAATAAAAQSQLVEVQRYLEELRTLRLEEQSRQDAGIEQFGDGFNCQVEAV